MKAKTKFRWTNDRAMRFAKVSGLGPYGDYDGCNTMESKRRRFIDIELNRLKPIPTHIIKVEVEITKKDIDMDDVRKAITRGVFYGLDTKRVATPSEIKVKSVKLK